MRTYTFAELAVGQQESFEVIVTSDSLDQFRALSGDENPLHCDDVFACARGFTGRVVYGMQLASYFSTLVGMYLPGAQCLYVSQEVNFHSPAYIGDALLVRGTVVQKVSSVGILLLKTEIIRNATGALLVDGTAQVKLIDAYDGT